MTNNFLTVSYTFLIGDNRTSLIIQAKVMQLDLTKGMGIIFYMIKRNTYALLNPMLFAYDTYIWFPLTTKPGNTFALSGVYIQGHNRGTIVI